MLWLLAIQVGPGLSPTVCTSGCYYVPNAFHHKAYLFSRHAQLCVDIMCMANFYVA